MWLAFKGGTTENTEKYRKKQNDTLPDGRVFCPKAPFFRSTFHRTKKVPTEVETKVRKEKKHYPIGRLYSRLEGEIVGDGAFGFDGYAVEEGGLECGAFGGVFGGLAEHGVAGGCFGIRDVAFFVELDLYGDLADDA